MKLVLQKEYWFACQQACIAMLAGVELKEVIDLVGPEILTLERRDKCHAYFGLVKPATGKFVHVLGGNYGYNLSELMKEHDTWLCYVYDWVDDTYAHNVIIHEGSLYDPRDGIDPEWPWSRFIRQADAYTLKTN